MLAGGENYLGSRTLLYDWVKKICDACVEYDVQFILGQTGNIFVKDGEVFKIRNGSEQMARALRSGLNHPAKDIETGGRDHLCP